MKVRFADGLVLPLFAVFADASWVHPSLILLAENSFLLNLTWISGKC